VAHPELGAEHEIAVGLFGHKVAVLAFLAGVSLLDAVDDPPVRLADAGPIFVDPPRAVEKLRPSGAVGGGRHAGAADERYRGERDHTENESMHGSTPSR